MEVTQGAALSLVHSLRSKTVLTKDWMDSSEKERKEPWSHPHGVVTGPQHRVRSPFLKLEDVKAVGPGEENRVSSTLFLHSNSVRPCTQKPSYLIRSDGFKNISRIKSENVKWNLCLPD